MKKKTDFRKEKKKKIEDHRLKQAARVMVVACCGNSNLKLETGEGGMEGFQI